MSRDDPFRGIRLSERASMGKLDQRLFTRHHPKPDEPETPRRGPPAQSRSDASVGSSEPAPVFAQPKHPDAAPESFDLTKLALWKGTFVFTREELDALEDLKLELSRALDRKVNKYDLMRAALHMLLEDHKANAEKSYVTKKIRKR